MNTCSKCGKTFTLHHNLVRHDKFCKAGKSFNCSKCEYRTNRVDNLRRHELVCRNKKIRNHSLEQNSSNSNKTTKINNLRNEETASCSRQVQSFMHCCNTCGRVYRNISRYCNHLNTHNMSHDINNLENNSGTITLSESALNGHARVYDVTPSSTFISIDDFLNEMRSLLANLVESLQNNYSL